MSHTPDRIAKLSRQQSFGACSRQLEMAGTVVRDTRLAPSVELPRHLHLEPYLCIVLDGNYSERARHEIEDLLDARVYLELFVRVDEGWSTKREDLQRLGYGEGGSEDGS